jgi:hypothetical protein
VACERIAYGVLVAAIEDGLVSTLQHAMNMLPRFSAPAGALGGVWLREQESTGECELRFPRLVLLGVSPLRLPRRLATTR